MISETLKLKIAAFLFKYAYPVYHFLYFTFKYRKDACNLLLIKKLLKPGAIVLDIGANIGFYSKNLSEATGINGHVYCFEPDETNFRHLRDEMAFSKNTTLIKKAVAADSGTLTLYTSNLLNVDHRTYTPEKFTNKYTVEKISIDDFVMNRFPVDFIKMDIQGFEMEALTGMTKTLDANKNIVVFMEFWPYGLEQAGTSAMALYDFMKSLSFNIYKIEEDTLSPLTKEEVLSLKVEYFCDLNVIASRNEVFQ